MGAHFGPAEVVYSGGDDPQVRLPLASDGVTRIIWRMQYTEILIEIRDGATWVNGQKVEQVT